MGSALHIPLVPGTKAGSTTKVTIFYKTTKDSTALQWLVKEYIWADFHIHTYIYAPHALGRHRASNSPTSSASVNRYMPEHWHHYKVRTPVRRDSTAD